MPDSPTHPEPLSGEQRFHADLVTCLDSLPVGELAALLCELPVMSRITLMHELSDRGPAWARLPVTWPQHPDAEHMGRRSLRELLADRRAARAPSAAPAHPNRQPTRAATGWSPGGLPAAAWPGRWPSGGWPKRCAAQPRPGRRG
jgi:hypothetical protein